MSIGATALILSNRIAATIDITLVTRAFYADQRANAVWLALFELSLAYSPTDFGIPTSVTLRLGHVCRKHTISRRFPVGRTYRLYAIAHSFFANRLSSYDGWAANVTLCPYNEAERLAAFFAMDRSLSVPRDVRCSTYNNYIVRSK